MNQIGCNFLQSQNHERRDVKAIELVRSIVIAPIKIAVFIGLLTWSIFAVLAFLGFLHPLADALNHFQPIWFFGLVVLLVSTIVLFKSTRMRTSILSFGLVGFILSAIPLMGEVLRATFALNGRDSGTYEITLMSRNLFGLNYDMQSVAKEILAQDPDILTFQEYFIEQSSRLHPIIIATYPFFADCTGGGRAAIAIYSKIPFDLSDLSVCPNVESDRDRSVARLVATFSPENVQPWAVVTTHLNWPVQISALRRPNLTMVEKIAGMTARKDNEMADLAVAMNEIDMPKVVVGDFNSTPWSYQLTQFANATELTRHTKNMPTFPARFYIKGWRQTLPVLPLDHLFAGGGAYVFDLQPLAAAGSDHLALLAQIAIPLS